MIIKGTKLKTAEVIYQIKDVPFIEELQEELKIALEVLKC